VTIVFWKFSKKFHWPCCLRYIKKKIPSLFMNLNLLLIPHTNKFENDISSSVIQKINFNSDSNHENQSQFKSGSYPPKLTFLTTLKKHTHTFYNAKNTWKTHFTMKKTKNTLRRLGGSNSKLFYIWQWISAFMPI
jgi:hypothetical protein